LYINPQSEISTIVSLHGESRNRRKRKRWGKERWKEGRERAGRKVDSEEEEEEAGRFFPYTRF